jgi:hypothetical protein
MFAGSRGREMTQLIFRNVLKRQDEGMTRKAIPLLKRKFDSSTSCHEATRPLPRANPWCFSTPTIVIEICPH